MEHGLILEPRRLDEIDKTNYSKYCLYHQLIIHPVENFFVVKGKIHELINRNTIALPTE